MTDDSGRDALQRLLAEELRAPPTTGVRHLVAALLARLGERVQAVVYYGSCLRRGDEEGIVDLYVLVDDYRLVYPSRGHAWLNRLLPPNVFYLESRAGDSGRTLRSKYAVISLEQLARFTSPACFQSYLWARLAQPCVLAYARDAATARRVEACIAAAVTTFVARNLPLMPPGFTAEALWTQALLRSYRAELRPEGESAVTALVEAAPQRYRRVTAAVLPRLPVAVAAQGAMDVRRYSADIPPALRRRARVGWALRRVQGKALNVLRLAKGVLTFEGGVDYVLWKVERHSGVRIEASAFLRRHPILGAWSVAWRLYRRGGFH
jgi:hypothetical protein